MTIPKTKQDFLERETAGEFGNRFRRWNPDHEYILEPRPPEYVTIRSKVRDSPCFLPITEGGMAFEDAGKLLNHCGGRLDDLYFQEVPGPDVGRVLNFEAGLGADGRLFCRYGEPGTTLNLRHDLEQNGTEVAGLAAALMLRRHLSEECDVLLDLVYDYPGAVVEATMWTRALGTLNRPLLIWEVRGY